MKSAAMSEAKPKAKARTKKAEEVKEAPAARGMTATAISEKAKHGLHQTLLVTERVINKFTDAYKSIFVVEKEAGAKGKEDLAVNFFFILGHKILVIGRHGDVFFDKKFPANLLEDDNLAGGKTVE